MTARALRLPVWKIRDALIELMGDPAAVDRWMARAHSTLGGETPMEAIARGREDQVWAVIKTMRIVPSTVVQRSDNEQDAQVQGPA